MIGRHKDGCRPAAAACERLADSHIDTVDIGTFLLVHLDGNKIPVQDCGDLLILEAFVRHHMTPVAGAVTDAQKDRLILLFGPAERLLVPRVPVHGIFRVLQQIGACLVFQMIAQITTSQFQIPRCGVVYQAAVLRKP